MIDILHRNLPGVRMPPGERWTIQDVISQCQTGPTSLNPLYPLIR